MAASYSETYERIFMEFCKGVGLGPRRTWLDFGDDSTDVFADAGLLSKILYYQEIAAVLSSLYSSDGSAVLGWDLRSVEFTSSLKCHPDIDWAFNCVFVHGLRANFHSETTNPKNSPDSRVLAQASKEKVTLTTTSTVRRYVHLFHALVYFSV